LTPEQHNKYLGVSHLVHGGLFLLLMLFMMIFMTVIFLSAPGPGAPPAGFLVFMWVFVGGFYGLMTVPSLVAGYGLLKRKPWARTAAIVGAVTSAMSFPIGTAVCVYTFWFLFSEPGKLLYDRPRFALPEPPNWQVNTMQQLDSQYTPPPTPPDWR
jgi:hypothetical protein